MCECTGRAPPRGPPPGANRRPPPGPPVGKPVWTKPEKPAGAATAPGGPGGTAVPRPGARLPPPGPPPGSGPTPPRGTAMIRDESGKALVPSGRPRPRGAPPPESLRDAAKREELMRQRPPAPFGRAGGPPGRRGPPGGRPPPPGAGAKPSLPPVGAPRGAPSRVPLGPAGGGAGESKSEGADKSIGGYTEEKKIPPPSEPRPEMPRPQVSLRNVSLPPGVLKPPTPSGSAPSSKPGTPLAAAGPPGARAPPRGLPPTKRPPPPGPGQRGRPLPAGPPPGAGTGPAPPPPPREIAGPPKPKLPADVGKAPVTAAGQPKKGIPKGTPMPGRMHVTMIGGRDITKHDKSSKARATKIDPYFKFECGTGTVIKKRGVPVKNQNRNPDFGRQEVTFDIISPQDMLDPAGNFLLKFQVWDDNTFSDDLLGEGEVSLLPYFQTKANKKLLSLTYTPAKKNAEPEPAGEVMLELRFEPAFRGILVVTCYEGRDLRNMELIGKQDPYCMFELGDQKVRTATDEDGGRNPYFAEEEVELWIDRANWTQPVRFRVFDEDVGRDDFIGGANFSVLPFLTSTKRQEVMVSLTAGKKGAGRVRLGIQFFPAGQLTVRCVAGRNLADLDTMGRQDPYCVFTIDGECRSFRQKTAVDTDGGTQPVWDELLQFDAVDHHVLQVEVFDKDLIDKDDLIGRVDIPLLDVFKYGVRDGWVPLRIRTKWGKEEMRGEIKLELDFRGPKGVKFPQRQPDVDSFDETHRKTRVEAQAEAEKKGKRGAADGEEDKTGGAAKEEEAEPVIVPSMLGIGETDEYTDKEIEDAFRFIDLDKNMFVGAAELRHVLICMGELITDEEINEMIRMVDTDGDGQVSFEEFLKLAKHPDPSRADFNNPLAEEAEGRKRRKEKKLVSAGMGGFGGGPPPPPPAGSAGKGNVLGTLTQAEQQALELKKKGEKKILLAKFTEDNAIRLPELKRAFKKFQNMDNFREGMVTFEQLVDIFNCEPTGETRKLFNVFAPPDDATRVDIRELMLGVNNFTGADRSARVNFCFYLFDEDNSGSIDQAELMHVLRANHMASDESSVRRKAQMIMTAADEDGDGTISLDEFYIISQKFPNVLFPAFSN